MPKYVVERQYLLPVYQRLVNLLPVYQRLVIEADTVEEACEKAIDHDDWEDAVEDVSSPPSPGALPSLEVLGRGS
jgi:hypothetical protein